MKTGIKRINTIFLAMRRIRYKCNECSSDEINNRSQLIPIYYNLDLVVIISYKIFQLDISCNQMRLNLVELLVASDVTSGSSFFFRVDFFSSSPEPSSFFLLVEALGLLALVDTDTGVSKFSSGWFSSLAFLVLLVLPGFLLFAGVANTSSSLSSLEAFAGLPRLLVLEAAGVAKLSSSTTSLETFLALPRPGLLMLAGAGVLLGSSDSSFLDLVGLGVFNFSSS